VKLFQRVLLLLVILFALGGALMSQASSQNELKALETTFGGTSSGADDAITRFDLNSVGTDTVYQQQVVALWAVKDLLKVVADEQVNNNSIGEAIVASSIAQTNAQIATNWLLAALISVICLVGLYRTVDSVPSSKTGEMFEDDDFSHLRS
jgi:hypothetical protein